MENDIQEKTSLTKEDVAEKISSWTYTYHMPAEENASIVTMCVMVMLNGASFVGINHGHVDRKKHSPDLARRLAYDDAFNQAWASENYLLRNDRYLKNQQ